MATSSAAPRSDARGDAVSLALVYRAVRGRFGTARDAHGACGADARAVIAA
jgi:hypothetical protein